MEMKFIFIIEFFSCNSRIEYDKIIYPYRNDSKKWLEGLLAQPPKSVATMKSFSLCTKDIKNIYKIKQYNLLSY